MKPNLHSLGAALRAVDSSVDALHLTGIRAGFRHGRGFEGAVAPAQRAPLLRRTLSFLPSAVLALCLSGVPSAPGQNVDDGFNPNAGGPVYASAVQTNGQIIIGGSFATLGGTNQSRLARLNLDGRLDTSFTNVANGTVWSLATQADGKILVGGEFTTIGGEARNRIARLQPDGSLDATFTNDVNNAVWSMAAQADGRILLGGGFTMVGGQPRNYIARLNADGSLDGAFNPDANSSLRSLALQADGKILVGGYFTTLGGQSRNRIARLNPDGTLDSAFDPEVNSSVWSLVVQADGKILVGGEFNMLSGQTRTNIARLHADGTLDAAFDPGANSSVYRMTLQPDGKILVGGSFTTLGGQSRTNIGRLHPNGSLDTSFDPRANALVFALAVQADGKILAGGQFTALGGQARNYVGRLYADGSLDAPLNPVAGTNVYALAVQPDGRILAGGAFTNLAGQSRNRIARLLPNGSLDTAFNPNANNVVYAVAVQSDLKILMGGAFTSVGGLTRNRLARLQTNGAVDTGFTLAADGEVYAFAVQTNGQVLVGGNFTTVGGQPRTNLARLNANGTLDLLYTTAADGPVRSLAVQADGKLVVGGDFSMLGGQPRSHLGRLDANGNLDGTFTNGANNAVYCLAVQTDGKILVGGNFLTLGGQTRIYLGRLNANGTVDTFHPLADRAVYTLALQTDGKILAGGDFTVFDTTGCNRIGRLNPDGTVDTSFNPGASNIVYAVAVQADGKILVGGAFTSLGGQTRSHIARLTGGSLAPQALSLDSSGAVVTWSRGGGGPELEQVAFELSPDGTSYNQFLGNGTRISGGWQISGLSQAPGVPFYIRARGRILGGRYDGSSGLIESVQQFLIPSTNANLSSMVLYEGTLPQVLTPPFDRDITAYSAGVANEVGYLTVTPTREDSKAWIQVRVNDGPYQLVASGDKSGPLLLNTGTNLVEVLVTAQNLVNTRTYSIEVVRAVPPTPWLGPFYPPRAGDPIPLSVQGTNGSIGRSIGMHWLFGSVVAANDYPTHWGATNGGIRLSFDNEDYVPEEILTYQPALSSLVEGIAVWSGQTTLPAPDGRTVYTRFVLTVTKYPEETAIPLTEAVNLGLPENLGGLVRVTPGLQYRAVLRFQASLDVNGPFEPALDLYDRYTAGPSYDNGAYSDFAAGFYLLNRPPVLTANNLLTTNRFASRVISSALLSATDADTPVDRIRFTVAPNAPEGNPVCANGDLVMNGTNLTVRGSFSQTDINNARVTYVHNGNCETNDSFTFMVTDDAGGIASDAGFTVFTFRVRILQPNLRPVALNDSAATGLQAPFHGFLPATNADCTPQTLAFRIVSPPGKADVVLDDVNTGAFTYTPKAGFTGADDFTFQVNDGEYDSLLPGTFSFTISNMPPVAHAGSGTTHENVAFSGTLSATDPDLPPQALTFVIVTNGLKGSAAISDPASGAFSYTPLAGAIGTDTLSFKVSDALMLTSAPAPFTVTIRPNLEEGDLLVTDTNRVVLVDPSGALAAISSGGLLSYPRGVTVHPDGDVLVMDRLNGLIRIDPVDGAQSLVSSPTNFSAAPIGVWGIAVETAGTILVADGTNGVLRVDPATGVPAVLAAGEPLPLTFGVSVAPDGGIWVSDVSGFLPGTNVSRVLRINPVTGAPTIVSANTNLVVPAGLAMEKSGMLAVVDFGRTNVLWVNPTNGSQTVLSSAGLFADPIGLALGTNGMIYVANNKKTSPIIVRVDPVTGAQSLFASGFTQLFGIAVVPVAPNPMLYRIVRILPAADRVEVDFQGLASESYALERSTAFDTWDEVDVAMAAGDGLVQFVDAAPLPGHAFYRVRWP